MESGSPRSLLLLLLLRSLLPTFFAPHGAEACTNLLVSRGASASNATQLAYNADSGGLYGSLGFYPAADHPVGARREIWDWDGSFFLGTIPEANHTYTVVGNANEHGLVIGETTFGGLPQLNGAGTGAVLDYGSLIWVTLQRAKTAREAIKLFDDLISEYGYASEGESFSFADPEEVWLMELIGKGNYSKGAVWVAKRVPEGMVGSTANQARIQQFERDSPDTCLFAKDVVDFAREIGLYPKDKPDEEFSFSDTYDPVTFGGVRLGEARVWDLFNSVTEGGFSDYLDYAQGYNLTNRMPLFAKPTRKLSVNDSFALMRRRFESTWFDPRGIERSDVGAGPGHSPYRWRPLVWETSAGDRFVNERTIGVQQTAWSFVAESRSWMPDPFKALMWWAPDDSSTGVRIPVYGGVTKIPKSFADPVGQVPAAAVPLPGSVEADAYKMNLDSAFWVYNLVANMAYGERFDEIYPVILDKIISYQGELLSQTQKMDSFLLESYADSPELCVKKATDFVATTGDKVTENWRSFWMYLFSRYRDGFTFGAPTQPQCKPGERKACTSRLLPTATQSGYNKEWYERIVQDGENKEHYKVRTSQHLEELEAQKLRTLFKN